MWVSGVYYFDCWICCCVFFWQHNLGVKDQQKAKLQYKNARQKKTTKKPNHFLGTKQQKVKPLSNFEKTIMTTQEKAYPQSR